MRSDTEIAVLGCGPAGLATALALKQVGLRPRLFERFDKPAPVGSGLILQPAGLIALSALGLTDKIKALGQPIDRLFGRGAFGRVVLDVSYADQTSGEVGLAVHRAAIFSVLYDAVVAAGIPIETTVEITSANPAGAFRVSFDDRRGRTHGPFELVVDALGSRSPLLGDEVRHNLPYGAIWTTVVWPNQGFDGRALEQRYRGSSRMIGVLPIGKRHLGDHANAAFFWSMKPQDHGKWLAAGLEAWKYEVMEMWPEAIQILNQIRSTDQMTLASYSHHTAKPIKNMPLARVGDSAHSTSPQLGQGVNMALLDACALASALQDSGDIGAGLTDFYKRRRRHVALYQAASSLFTPFYQSDSQMLPWIRDLVVPPLAQLKPSRRLLASLVSGTIGLPNGDRGRPPFDLDKDALAADC